VATTGTAVFDLDLNNLVEEAFERCGTELRTGYDLKTARRSLNLLSIEWANRGVNLWTIEEGTIAMVASTTTYNLPLDTVDLLDTVIRTGTGTSQSDITIKRISSTTYAMIPGKNTTGRPIQVWVDRQSGATDPTDGVKYPTVNMWPVPDQSNRYTLVYWRLRRMQDVGDGTTTQDVPYRFLPAMVAGLAHYLSMKIPEAVSRIPMLEADYEKQWMLATGEDREKASLRIAPKIF